jgi:hypothetical protein
VTGCCCRCPAARPTTSPSGSAGWARDRLPRPPLDRRVRASCWPTGSRRGGVDLDLASPTDEPTTLAVVHLDDQGARATASTSRAPRRRADAGGRSRRCPTARRCTSPRRDHLDDPPGRRCLRGCSAARPGPRLSASTPTSAERRSPTSPPTRRGSRRLVATLRPRQGQRRGPRAAAPRTTAPLEVARAGCGPGPRWWSSRADRTARSASPPRATRSRSPGAGRGRGHRRGRRRVHLGAAGWLVQRGLAVERGARGLASATCAAALEATPSGSPRSPAPAPGRTRRAATSSTVSAPGALVRDPRARIASSRSSPGSSSA